MISTILALVVGLALLSYAADQFVLGAARVALIRKIPSLVVGVVIVGFGTSAPEMLVSGLAAFDGNPEIAIGNVVGSNLANLTLLLGIGALMIPLAVDSTTVRREGPMTIAAIVAFAIVAQGGGINVAEAAVLALAMAGSLVLVMNRSGADPLGSEAEELADPGHHRIGVEAFRTVLGLLGTVGGAQLLLWGATDVAARAGLAEGFVGATLVAVGTSLPELVTVIQSARRRETDLIVGNLLGSCVFNALGVGAIIGFIGAGSIDAPSLTTLGVLAAAAAAVVAVVAMRTKQTVSRFEGGVLVAGYAAFVPFLA
jgi:cation:H+ antiporter